MKPHESTSRFVEEIKTIGHDSTEAFCNHLISQIPYHFWEKPSSSTGKYHPEDEHGEGGLALHTLRVKKVADILLLAAVPPVLGPTVKVGALFHDVGRYGFGNTPEKYSLSNHAKLGCLWMQEQLKRYSPAYKDKELRKIVETASITILTHMGKWGKNAPESKEGWIVHLADMVASQYTP